VIDEMRGPFGHAPTTTGGTESAALTREGHQPLLAAAGAPEAREPARVPPAPQERLELVFDESRQSFSVAQPGRLGAERLVVIAHDLIEHRRGGIARRIRTRRQGHGPG